MNTDPLVSADTDDQQESPIAQTLDLSAEQPNLEDDPDKLKSTQSRQRLSSIIVIGLLAFLTGMSYTIIVPTAWGYMNEFVSEKYAGIALGLVLSLYSLASAVAGITFGYIYDIGVPLKRLILFGSLFQIVGNFFYFLGIDIYIVVISRFVTGVGMGIVPLLLADVSRRTTSETRTQILTRIIACRQFGFIFGPAITIFLEPINFKILGFTVNVYNSPGFLMAVLWFIMALVTIFLFYDLPIIAPGTKSMSQLLGGYSSTEAFKRMYQLLKQPVLAVLLIGTFVFFFNQSALNTFLTPFATYEFNWTSLGVSFLFLFIGIEVLIVYFLLNFIAKKFRDQTILLFAFGLLSAATLYAVVLLSLLSVRVVSSPGGFLLFFVLDMIAAPLLNVTTISLITKHNKHDQQGIGLGIQNAVFSIAAVLGPLYAGALLKQYLILFESLLMLIAVATILVGTFYRSFEVEKTDELSLLLPAATNGNS